jgi:transposase
MRGRRNPQITMLAFIDVEERIPTRHPLRTIRRLADEALADLSSVFDSMYAKDGRPSIPPERLLKASLLIALYSVRSERAFCEELEYNLLFRWFLDMDPIEPSFDPTVFTKNRERLLKHEVGQQLFDEVVGRAHARGLLSDEHFTVDGTLIEAAASLKSSSPRKATRRPPPTTIPATHRSTSTARSGRTRPTGARPTPTRDCTRRGKGRKRSSASWGTH